MEELRCVEKDRERILDWLSKRNKKILFRPTVLAKELETPVETVIKILLALVDEGKVTVRWEVTCGQCFHTVRTIDGKYQEEELRRSLEDEECELCGSAVLEDFFMNPVFGLR